MFASIFGSKTKVEDLTTSFYKLIDGNGRDLVHPLEFRYSINEMIRVKSHRYKTDAFVFATRHVGEAVASSGWTTDAYLIELKGREVGTHPKNEKISLLDIAFVVRRLPKHQALGDNGEAVIQFLDQLRERGDEDAPNHIPHLSWQKCSDYLHRQKADTKSNARVKAAWDEAYRLADEMNCVYACETAIHIANDIAVEASHFATLTKDRDRTTTSSLTDEARKQKRINHQIYEISTPMFANDEPNVGAGIVAETAALAVVVAKHLSKESFEALTEPFREFIDSELFLRKKTPEVPWYFDPLSDIEAD